MQQNDYKKLFEDFKGLNVLIIGDVMVDSYIWGSVNRISPEAPVPIVAVNKRESRLGGAANVALNIHSMGANPILCSVTGNDLKGDEFISLLEEAGMLTQGIVRSEERITTAKFRVLGNRVQLLRVDEEITSPLSRIEEEALIEKFLTIIEEKKIDAVIFQDYDKGVITPKLIQLVVSRCRQSGIPVTVDPKKNNFLAYRNVNLFKPNLKELKEGLHLEFDVSDKAALKVASARLRDELSAEIILITLSEAGIFVDYVDGDEKGTHVIPSWVRSVSDVSGAGDTVISVASLCLALGVRADEIAFMSNMAGGLVCERVGVVPVDKEQLLKEIVKLKSA